MRVRPLNGRERDAGARAAWAWRGNCITQQRWSELDDAPAEDGGPTFEFDHLFHPDAPTRALYATVARPIVVAAMEGYHGAVCAYGQTSTGKTHTMMGAGASAPGVVPLAIHECFAHISRADADREYVLRVSYLEIYNEALVDLLCPTTPSTAIRVLDD